MPGLALASVMDTAIIDCAGRRAGRVDDLALDVRKKKDGNTEIVLSDLVVGPLARPTWRALCVLARLCYRMIGLKNPRPAVIPWSHVKAIDAFINVDVDRGAAGMRTIDDRLGRIAMCIPGADHRP